MKKKQKFVAGEVGVSIGDSAVLPGKEKYKSGNYVVGLLLFAMMMVGMIECLVQGFSMSCMQKWLLFGILVSCLVFYTGFSSKRGAEIIIALYLVVYGVTSYLMRAHIANGLAVFVNTVLKRAGKYYRVTFVSYEEYENLNRQKSLTIFLLFVFVFLIGILAYMAAHKVATYFVIAITFVVAFSPEVVGLVPGEKAFTLYIVSVLVYVGSNIRHKNRQNVCATAMSVQWKVRLMQIVVGIGCTFLLFQVFTEDTYDKISKETDLKTFVQKTMQSCYNNTIRKRFDKGTVDGGISFGEIAGVDRIEYSDTVRLRVKYKTLDLSQRAGGGLYLRGYIGSRYKENQWQSLEQEEEEDCRQMEEKSGISLDDYDTASASYRMRLEEFVRYAPENSVNMFHQETTVKLHDSYEYPEGKEYITFGNYEPKMFREELKSIYSHTFSDVIVENVSETVSTQFIPYYVAADVEEKDGRLTSEETTDVGEYQWSIFNGQAETFGVVTDPYGWSDLYPEIDSLDYYDKMEILWKEFSFIREEVETAIGQNILDYKEGTYKGETVEEVCPDLLKELELTITDDTSMEIEEIDTGGKYDVNELLKRVAKYCVSVGFDMAASDEIYSVNGSGDAAYYQDDLGALSSSYYGQESAWDDVFGSEIIVRYMVDQADADEFFSLLKQMYRFYLQQKEYENFVEHTYMDVPENLKGKLKDIAKEAGMTGEKDLRRMISFVQSYLYDNTEYSLEPGTTPEGEDFTDYFLFQNKKGYCVHYATAAAMLFRSMGVPARYVEGYHADKDTLQNKSAVTMEGTNLWHTVELTDRYAHAWVEIYVSGYGWIPVEVTKAYLDINEEDRFEKKEEKDPQKEENGKSTTKPSNTAKPIQNTAEPQSSESPNSVDFTKYYGVFRVFFGIVVILLVIALRYALLTKKHEREGSLEDRNRAIYFYYLRMEQLLRILKQCEKKQSLRQLLQEQTLSVDGVDAGEWLRFYETMNDYTFSKDGVTGSQAAEGKQLYEKVRTAFYMEKKVWIRWYYKYIRCL